MMEWLARSSNNKTHTMPQRYRMHVDGVKSIAGLAVQDLAPFISEGRFKVLASIVQNAAEFHDLGKLDTENQAVLRKGGRGKLPWPHADAGSNFLLEQREFLAAILVYSHHQGLPNWIEEVNREYLCLRVRDEKSRQHTDCYLTEYLQRHGEFDLSKSEDQEKQMDVPDFSLFLRLSLSVLVDGDHTNSANHENHRAETYRRKSIALRPHERLKVLNQYVEGLKDDSDERSRIRSHLYERCRDANLKGASIVCCDNPVGTGKTTAVMAHLLNQAAQRGLRRIFVVLPYTNIISQSVKVYRKALVLPGENPIEVVAEVHHRADFEDESSREFAVEWRAPIIVTTAVAFFETMASSHPSALRRLHNLPGSAVFVDEAHASLPVRLLPLAWFWIRQFGESWSVYWVLASGSLNRFWNIREISGDLKYDVPDLIDSYQGIDSKRQEKERIQYQNVKEALSVDELLLRVSKSPGPRLVVVNTVQTAARIAKRFLESGAFDQVFHVSTALTPCHRESVLIKIQEALGRKDESNWVLIGTSCVEAGLDFSFRSGFREMASLVSLLQFSGRVNRSCREHFAPVYSFSFQEDPLLVSNPELENSIRVLKSLFDTGEEISASLCTESMRKEIQMMVNPDEFNKLVDCERQQEFPEVDKKFRVIPYTDSRTVVITPNTIDALESHTLSDWQDVQRNSVQLRGNRISELSLQPISGYMDIYKWSYEYDPLIGCMGYILKFIETSHTGFCII